MSKKITRLFFWVCALALLSACSSNEPDIVDGKLNLLVPHTIGNYGQALSVVLRKDAKLDTLADMYIRGAPWIGRIQFEQVAGALGLTGNIEQSEDGIFLTAPEGTLVCETGADMLEYIGNRKPDAPFPGGIGEADSIDRARRFVQSLGLNLPDFYVDVHCDAQGEPEGYREVVFQRQAKNRIAVLQPIPAIVVRLAGSGEILRFRLEWPDFAFEKSATLISVSSAANRAKARGATGGCLVDGMEAGGSYLAEQVELVYVLNWSKNDALRMVPYYRFSHIAQGEDGVIYVIALSDADFQYNFKR